MYRKFRADNIFTGYELLAGQFVLITTTEGLVIEIVKAENAGENIEKFNGIICPGFVNTHCHVELSNLKHTIPAGTGLVQFVQQVIAKRFLFEDDKLQIMQNAVQEMEDCGIVAVGDICNTADAIQAKKQSKMRWHNFIEVSGFVNGAAAQRLQAAKVVADIYKKDFNKTTLSPHAPYSVSETLFKQLNIETTNELITIHSQECAAENELYLTKKGGFLELYKNFGIDISSFEPSGKTSLQTWLPYFFNNQTIISVHNTETSLSDLNYINTRTTNKLPVYFCLCINANKYIEQKIPPIELLRKNNCLITLGTDSYASNNQLNILEEIKTIQKATAYAVPLAEILKWATSNGAGALQLDKELGSFEKGKIPGIVLIDHLENNNTTELSAASRIL